MSTNLLLKIGIALLLIAGFFAVYDHFGKAENDGDAIMGKFMVIAAGGIVGAILVGMFVVPMFGDAVGNVVYSGGGEVEDDGSSAAVAKMAQGDYEGAIKEYKKLIPEKPGESLPVWEVAKIHAENLEDPDTAIEWIGEQLEEQEWGEDEGAFLMFRLSELHDKHKEDPDTAREILQQIVGTFTGTRHAANATSKIRKMEQAMMKGPKVDAQLPGAQGSAGGPSVPGGPGQA